MRERMAKLQALKQGAQGGAGAPPTFGLGGSAMPSKPPTAPPPLPTPVARPAATSTTDFNPVPGLDPVNSKRSTSRSRAATTAKSEVAAAPIPAAQPVRVPQPQIQKELPSRLSSDPQKNTQPSAPQMPHQTIPTIARVTPSQQPSAQPIPTQPTGQSQTSDPQAPAPTEEDAKARAMRLLAERRAKAAAEAAAKAAEASANANEEGKAQSDAGGAGSGDSTQQQSQRQDPSAPARSKFVEDPQRRVFREGGDGNEPGYDPSSRGGRGGFGRGGGGFGRGGFGGDRGRGGGRYSSPSDGPMSRGHRSRPGCTVRVEGFPFDATPEQVQRLMALHGEIYCFTMNPGSSSCSCEYTDPVAARRAVERLSGTTPFGFGTRPLQASIYSERALKNQERFYADLDGGVALAKDKVIIAREAQRALRAQGIDIRAGGPIIPPMNFVQEPAPESTPAPSTTSNVEPTTMVLQQSSVPLTATSEAAAEFTKESNNAESDISAVTANVDAPASSRELTAEAQSLALELIEANEKRGPGRRGLGAPASDSAMEAGAPAAAVPMVPVPGVIPGAAPVPVAAAPGVPESVLVAQAQAQMPAISWSAVANATPPGHPDSICVARHYNIPLVALVTRRPLIQYADVL